MRPSAENASQISDEEIEGGICPSCRLAVNKDTGRLKWCMGGNDVWRTWIRLMLLIPAVILPVAIVVIALSKSTVIGKLSMQPGQGDDVPASPGLPGHQPEHYPPNRANDVERSAVEGNILGAPAESSFLPPEFLIASKHARRRKRRDEPQQPEGRGSGSASPRTPRGLDGDRLQQVQVKFLKE